jgi:CheY-like chemotaxis protein
MSRTTPASLRILFVEGSLDDAECVVRHLRNKGCDLTFERVQSAADMRAALKNQTWDVIVGDYSMPGFDALQALSIVKDSGLDVPFIYRVRRDGRGTAVRSDEGGSPRLLRQG